MYVVEIVSRVKTCLTLPTVGSLDRRQVWAAYLLTLLTVGIYLTIPS